MGPKELDFDFDCSIFCCCRMYITSQGWLTI